MRKSQIAQGERWKWHFKNFLGGGGMPPDPLSGSRSRAPPLILPLLQHCNYFFWKSVYYVKDETKTFFLFSTPPAPYSRFGQWTVYPLSKYFMYVDCLLDNKITCLRLVKQDGGLVPFLVIERFYFTFSVFLHRFTLFSTCLNMV